MKTLINKITNKDRLIKLYGCSECDNEICDRRDSSKCDANGYTINRDSHILDIADELLEARFLMNLEANTKTEDLRIYHINNDLGQALIKLIELHAYEGKIPSKDPISKKKIKPLYGDFLTDNEKAFRIMIQRLSENRHQVTYRLLLSFCKHHKIDIWQSVAEILEGEK